MFSSERPDWGTPRHHFAAWDTEFGGFDLDAAARADNALVGRWLGPGGLAPDALAVPWADYGRRVWCNPPYSRRAMGAWFLRAREAAAAGATVVMLLASRTDNAWFHDHVLGVAEIRFLRGRIKFVPPPGATPKGNNPAFGSLLAIYRPPSHSPERTDTHASL